MTTATDTQKFIINETVSYMMGQMIKKMAAAGYTEQQAQDYLCSPEGMTSLMRLSGQAYKSLPESIRGM